MKNQFNGSMKQESHVYAITFIKAFFLTIATFLTPIKGLLIITGMAVLLDTIFAIYTTIKLNGWASYQSTKLFNIVVKSFFYLGSIVLAYFIDTHIIEKNTLFGINLLMFPSLLLYFGFILN